MALDPARLASRRSLLAGCARRHRRGGRRIRRRGPARPRSRRRRRDGRDRRHLRSRDGHDPDRQQHQQPGRLPCGQQPGRERVAGVQRLGLGRLRRLPHWGRRQGLLQRRGRRCRRTCMARTAGACTSCPTTCPGSRTPRSPRTGVRPGSRSSAATTPRRATPRVEGTTDSPSGTPPSGRRASPARRSSGRVDPRSPAPSRQDRVYGYASQDASSRGLYRYSTSGGGVNGVATSGTAGYSRRPIPPEDVAQGDWPGQARPLSRVATIAKGAKSVTVNPGIDLV